MSDRGSLHRRTGGSRYLLRRRAQGGWQGVSTNRAGMLQSPRLGTALHQQVAGHLGPVLNEAVLPLFEAHEAQVYTILSDNGHEFCGRPDHHPYELFLQLEGLSTGQPRCAGRRATSLSSGCTAPCWMNTSASRGGRSGMSRWGRCRQTWIATWNITTTSGHIRAG